VATLSSLLNRKEASCSLPQQPLQISAKIRDGILADKYRARCADERTLPKDTDSSEYLGACIAIRS